MKLKVPSKKTSSAKPSKQDSAQFSFSLPTSSAAPPKSLLEYSTLIYGEAGSGKTSTVAALGEVLGGNVLMLAWEASDESIRSRRTPLLSNDVNWPKSGLSGWEKALIVAEQFSKDYKKENYVAVCFDTVAPSFERCLEYVCKRERMQHPGEMDDFGASWKKVRTEFSRYSELYRSLGVAVFALAHEALEPIDTRSGKKYFMMRPALSGKLLDYYRQSTAIIGYLHRMDGKSWMQIRGDEFVMAKSNPEGHFKSLSGDRIEKIPMGNTAKEAATNIVRAFDNKQKGVYDSRGIEVVATANQKGKFGKAVVTARSKK